MASDVVGTPAAPEAVEAPRRGWIGALDKGLLWSLLELFVLTGFVVAQPLLDVTGKAPDFFIFRRADRLDILLLVGIVTVLPALYLWVFELIMRLAGERARHALHLLIVTSLLAILAMEVGKKLLPLRGKRLGLVAVVVALALGFLYLRQAWLRMWLRYLAPAPLVFALLFATTSPSATLLRPAKSASASESGVRVASAVQRPPVVMVFFDEFPLESLLDSSGHVDSKVYPNFAALADRSHWYRNATGVSGFTPWAVPAMLIGAFTLAGYWPVSIAGTVKAPITQEYPDNLFT